MIDLAAIIVFLALLICSSGLVAARILRLLQLNSYLRIFGELFIPSLMLLVYGWFALPILFADMQTYAQLFGVAFEKIDLLLGFFCMTLVALFYFLGYCAVTNGHQLTQFSKLQPPLRQRRAFLAFVIALIIFDLVIRAQLIASGQYISWMSGARAAAEGVSLTPSAMLQSGIAPLVTACIVYLSINNKKWLLYLLLLGVLLIIQGSRQTIAYSLIAGVFLYYMMRPERFRVSKFALRFFALLVVFYIGSAAVLEVRKEFRLNMKEAMADPVGFVVFVTTDTLPKIATFQERDTSEYELSGASLRERTSLWATTFSAEVHQLRNGYSFLPLDLLWSELTTPVPSLIWPGEKPSIEIGDIRLKWFGFTGRERFDPGSTVFSAFFAYFGPVGALIYGFFVGIAIGWIVRYLVTHFAVLGSVVVIGAIQFISIFANSFSGILVGIRNSLICVIAVYLVLTVGRVRIRWRHLELSRPPQERI